MKIIGFGHRKRVGKDVAATLVLSDLKINYRHLKSARLSFGDQLKDIAYQMFKWGGLESSIYYHNNSKEIEQILPALGKSPRQIWDEIGLYGRMIHPQAWVEMAAASADGDILISPDVRFPSEIDLIRRFGGLVIKIERDSAPLVHSPVDEALADFNGWDAIISNNGSMREFNASIRNLIKPFLQGLG